MWCGFGAENLPPSPRAQTHPGDLRWSWMDGTTSGTKVEKHLRLSVTREMQTQTQFSAKLPSNARQLRFTFACAFSLAESRNCDN